MVAPILRRLGVGPGGKPLFLRMPDGKLAGADCCCAPPFTQGCQWCDGTQAIRYVRIQITGYTGACAVHNRTVDYFQHAGGFNYDERDPLTESACRFQYRSANGGDPGSGFELYDSIDFFGDASNVSWTLSQSHAIPNAPSGAGFFFNGPTESRPFDCNGFIGSTGTWVNPFGACPGSAPVATIIDLIPFFP